jgi:RNA polymerase sigma-70 factor (ECF subfamily)
MRSIFDAISPMLAGPLTNPASAASFDEVGLLSTAMAIDDGDAPDAGERGLVAAARHGDGLAYRRLVEPHLAMLLRIARRVTGDRQLAEEAVQETLALAYERLASYRHETPFRSFLAGVAARQAHTLARGERRRKRREGSAAHPETVAGPEEAAHAADAARQLREALLAMPDKRRRAALLRLDAGLPYRDIARALGSTEGSARVLVHTALQELRERLAGLLSDDGANP